MTRASSYVSEVMNPPAFAGPIAWLHVYDLHGTQAVGFGVEDVGTIYVTSAKRLSACEAWHPQDNDESAIVSPCAGLQKGKNLRR